MLDHKLKHALLRDWPVQRFGVVVALVRVSAISLAKDEVSDGVRWGQGYELNEAGECADAFAAVEQPFDFEDHMFLPLPAAAPAAQVPKPLLARLLDALHIRNSRGERPVLLPAGAPSPDPRADPGLVLGSHDTSPTSQRKNGASPELARALALAGVTGWARKEGGAADPNLNLRPTPAARAEVVDADWARRWGWLAWASSGSADAVALAAQATLPADTGDAILRTQADGSVEALSPQPADDSVAILETVMDGSYPAGGAEADSGASITVVPSGAVFPDGTVTAVRADSGDAIMVVQADAAAQARVGAPAGGRFRLWDWLEGTWRSATGLGYDPLPSAGGWAAPRRRGGATLTPDQAGFGSGARPRGAVWDWLEGTWQSAAGLGFDTLPLDRTTLQPGNSMAQTDAGAAADAYVVPAVGGGVGFAQALQAAGGAVVLDLSPAPGGMAVWAHARPSASRRMGAASSEAGHPEGKFTGLSEPGFPERAAAAAMAADIAEHGRPVHCAGWERVRAWLHWALDRARAPVGAPMDPNLTLWEPSADDLSSGSSSQSLKLQAARARLAGAEAAVASAEAAVADAVAAAASGCNEDVAVGTQAGPAGTRAGNPTAGIGSLAAWLAEGPGMRDVALAVAEREHAAQWPLSASGRTAGLDANPGMGQSLSDALDNALRAAHGDGRAAGGDVWQPSQGTLSSVQDILGSATLRLRLRGGAQSAPQIVQISMRAVPKGASGGVTLQPAFDGAKVEGASGDVRSVYH